MIKMMTTHFKQFKKSFMTFIDKILTLDAKDQIIKGIYKLLDKFYSSATKVNSFKDSKAKILLIGFR